MKKLRWQILIVVLALAAIAVLLIGQRPAVLEQILPAQPASGGTYAEALVGSFSRINPLLDFYNPADRDICRLLFRGLVQFDDRGIPTADIADSWNISEDGLTYNFAIREAATWHDGEPVTAEDVVFTVDLLRSEELPAPDDLKSLWKLVEVQALDAKTVQFVLPEPYAPFLDQLTLGLLPKHLLAEIPAGALVEAPFNLAPVGNGPYQFDHLIVENDQIRGVALAAFKKFYGQAPFIDQVIFRYYPDAPAAFAAYQQGEVMGISQVSAEILPEVLQEPGLNLYTGRLPQLTLVYLNLNNPQATFFQDAAVRRALLLGANRQWLVDNVLQGQALVADGPILPGTWAYYSDIEHLDYDPAKALSILKEAGYTIPAEGESVRAKEGVALRFELLHPDTPQHTAIAEALKRDWARLGVQADLVAAPFDELVSTYLEPRAYQAALVDLTMARTPDPDPYPFWSQAQAKGGQNYAQWEDRKASEYLEQARVTTDMGEREKAYRNFQVRFTMEIPALPLYYPVYSYAVNAEVQRVRIGAFFDPSDRFNTLTTWFLNVKEPAAGETITPEN